MMDWTTILTFILGGGGLVSGLWGWLSSRRINTAQANATEAQAQGGIAAWAENVIKQAEDLTKQHKENAEFWKNRTIEAEAYSKDLRIQNRELRKENGGLKEDNHNLKMDSSNLQHKLDFVEWKKCERTACPERIPPRDEDYESNLHNS